MRNLVDDLRDAAVRDPNPWDVTLYERAADEIGELRRTVEDLQAKRDRWRDIADSLAKTSHHLGVCPSHDGFACDNECGVGATLADYENEKGKTADGTVEGGGK